ncbi:hypothetical protein I4U23_010052 [Adineta vaga]|nr:hypothetical protein I4U23_010052 [Adineta vaga]
MSRVANRRLTTIKTLRMYTQRPPRQRLRRTISNHIIKTTVSLLSKTYGILPCFCEHDPKRLQTMKLSKSSNTNKSHNQKQQRNNSTRTIIRKQSHSTSTKHTKNAENLSINHSNTSQTTSLHQSPLILDNNEHSSHSFLTQDHLYTNNEIEMNDTLLELPLSSKNVNATNNSDHKRSQTMIKNSSSTVTSKRKTNQTIHNQSPFPNPNIFHSLPRMHDSDEITENNVHENHLCCKPITSVKGLSTNDQKKLIENDYLTLISLLPITSVHKISLNGANELDRLMNEWSSARLFIGTTNPTKTLVQTI